jgi:hypothetical protein
MKRFLVQQIVGIETISYCAILMIELPMKMSLGNLNPMNRMMTEVTRGSKTSTNQGVVDIMRRWQCQAAKV